MCTNKMLDVCICVLAHNEQTHIADTLRSLVAESDFLACEIKVYANGCTDDTVKIVQELSRQYPRISLVELEIASKANAWNTAYDSNPNSILIFSDGDVVPEVGALVALVDALNKNAVLVGCSFWPIWNGLSLSQKIVGFLQIPLFQDFLSGQLYALRRFYFESTKEFVGMPIGLVADDFFLQKNVSQDSFKIISQKVYYYPPCFEEYLKYQARLRWQGDQARLFMNELAHDIDSSRLNRLARLVLKVKSNNNFFRLLLGLVSTSVRSLAILLNRKKILYYQNAMGPIVLDGSMILSQVTRSNSVK